MKINNRILVVISSVLIFTACNKSSSLQKEFTCLENNELGSLETIIDVKKLYSVKFPQHWKTNLYTDAIQSSIYTADTTKQLTETVLLDVTFINKEIVFDDVFKLKQENKNLSKKLIKTKSKETIIINKPSYYVISKGFKNKFPYQICNMFIKINESNFILAKTEIYGDSLIEKRLCKSIELIEKIKIQ